MPVNQNCFFKVNIGESEYSVKFTAQVMREFLKATQQSLFDVSAWVDDDDKVFIALELSLKAAGYNDPESIIKDSDMSLEDVGIFKAQLMLMISNIDDLQKKILIPLTMKTEKAQIQQQTQQMQILMELSKQQSTIQSSESAVSPDTK